MIGAGPNDADLLVRSSFHVASVKKWTPFQSDWTLVAKKTTRPTRGTRSDSSDWPAMRSRGSVHLAGRSDDPRSTLIGRRSRDRVSAPSIRDGRIQKGRRTNGQKKEKKNGQQKSKRKEINPQPNRERRKREMMKDGGVDQTGLIEPIIRTTLISMRR